MSAQKYATISAIHPLLHYLLNDVLKFSTVSSESLALQRMKREMSDNLSSRFQLFEVSHLIEI